MQDLVFNLGDLTVDALAYASQGNAVLGIRDSGKTYTATEIAEKLFEAGIPFITFDPTGVWKYLRVPGAGCGYPVVVAGGTEGDLPLTVAGAPAIVRAAMSNGVSLVIDLTSHQLSKADWRRIVRASVEVLMQENAAHGLRHVFLEEAAEFVPQKILDGQVYAAIEQLARVGGNSRLGYTLINQRTQEVNKAVLELCENLFLHRQRGKNALENIKKWFEVAEIAEQKEILSSLPRLPSGQCWAWMGGNTDIPMLISVPPKNSFHPDRRALRGDATIVTKPAVNVSSFLAEMKSALASIDVDVKESDVETVRAENKRLKAQLAERSTGTDQLALVDTALSLADAERGGYQRGKVDGFAAALKEVRDVYRNFAESVPPLGAAIEHVQEAARRMDDCILRAETLQPSNDSNTGSPASSFQAPAPSRKPTPPSAPRKLPSPALASGDGAFTNPQLTLLRALAWWTEMGHDEPTRPMLAAIAGWKPSGSNLKDRLSELSKLGLVSYPRTGFVTFTLKGAGKAPAPDLSATLIDSIRGILTGPQKKLFEILLKARKEMTRERLAEIVGWEPSGSNLKDRLSELSTLEIVLYPRRGSVQLQDWVQSCK